ncbi:MAG: T9SS type A sorting domain-containing protein [Bacteroidales bacterium]|nr:T9SS type A sorting domain-containing protein [Bacteroidales bacterium]
MRVDSPLPPGTYILTLTTPSGTASQSIIKN